MRRMIRLLSVAALLTGITLVAQGSYIQVKASVAQLLLERAWQQSLASGMQTRPWPWADSYPVAQLEIPRIGLKQIVLSGASGRNLAFAPTHLQSSAAPNSGSTTVLSAHRDTHFSGLQSVKKNDLITLHSPGQSRQYRVTAIDIADTRQQQLALDDGDRLVLVTCYPFATLATGGPLRYVVSAEPAPYQTATHNTRPMNKHPLNTQSLNTQPLNSLPLSTLPLSTLPLSNQPLTAQRGDVRDWVF